MDKFAFKAKSYDKEERRVANVKNIANKIIDSIPLNKNMRAIDFGSGTGLLLENIAPYVKEIIAIDKSPSMNEVLSQKIPKLDCKVEIKEIDNTKTDIDIKVDLILSSMTLHHIEDVKSILQKFYNMLNNNGYIAIADLDIEDGSFHQVDTGVYHFGFDRKELVKVAKEIGFKDIKIDDASIIKKPYGEYSVFLLTAKKASN